MSGERQTSATVKLTGICSALHFLVDGLCACTLYQVYALCFLPSETSFPTQLLPLFLTYNVLAFLTQPLTGILTDHCRQRQTLLLSAVGMLGMAVLLTALIAAFEALRVSPVPMFLVATLLGIGNSLFHVWGGKQTAVATGNDIRALGVFVATGALGLCIGYLFFSWPLIIAMMLAISALAYKVYDGTVIGTSADKTAEDSQSVAMGPLGMGLTVFLIVALMMVVMLRSCITEMFSSDIPKSTAIVLVIGTTAMLGKMAGGWFARNVGVIKALLALVLAVTLCLMLRGQGAVMLIAGLFLVNCTMPITLYLANVLLPGREGLAFGLLAAALMPGYLIALL